MNLKPEVQSKDHKILQNLARQTKRLGDFDWKMAGARLHQNGSIVKRLSGLMKAGVVPYKDRPIWYDVVTTFPPKIEPKLDQPVPKNEVKPIFYPEDYIRVRIFEKYDWTEEFSMRKWGNVKTFVDIFVEEYIKRQRPGATVDEIFKECETVFADSKWKPVPKGYRLVGVHEKQIEDEDEGSSNHSLNQASTVKDVPTLTDLKSEVTNSASSAENLDTTDNKSDKNS